VRSLCRPIAPIITFNIMTQHPTRRTVLDSATALASGSLVTGGALRQSDQQSAASTTADDPGFVRVEDGQFVRDGEPYRAIAGTTYGMMWNGLDYITQMVKSAKANGLRQLRATVIFSQLHNGGVDDPAIITEEKAHINDETIWTRIDWLLKEARDQLLDD